MATIKTSHTDIPSGDWVDRRLPASWRPYARLARLDRPIGTWLLLLPCWWALAIGIGQEKPATLLFYAILFAVGALTMRGAGCVINDMWDRDVDRQVERTQTRPLASGAISMKQATVFLCLLLSIGLAVILQFPLPVILYGLAACALVVIYPLMKRITWWPQAFLGFTFNWGALLGAATIGNTSTGNQTLWLPPDWAWSLYAAGVLWTLGYDTIYAHQDKFDDERVGVKSTALRLGTSSRLWVGSFYAGALALITLTGAAADLGGTFYIVLAGAAAHLFWQVHTWNMDNPQNCLQRFRSNRDFGLLVLLAVVCGQLIG